MTYGPAANSGAFKEYGEKREIGDSSVVVFPVSSRTEPERRDVLMSFASRVQSTGRQDLVREVGMGSRRHVVDLKFVMSSDKLFICRGEG